jgi:hypothetical protein
MRTSSLIGIRSLRSPSWSCCQRYWRLLSHLAFDVFWDLEANALDQSVPSPPFHPLPCSELVACKSAPVAASEAASMSSNKSKDKSKEGKKEEKLPPKCPEAELRTKRPSRRCTPLPHLGRPFRAKNAVDIIVTGLTLNTRQCCLKEGKTQKERQPNI